MLRLDFRVTSIFCLHHALYKIHTWKLFAYGKIKSERETLVKKGKKKEEKNSVKTRNKFLCESDWYWRSSTLASRFLTKKSPSSQTVPYIMIKRGFLFFMQALIQKHWQSPEAPQWPQIVIWKAVCIFVVLLLSTFSNFSIFAAGFSFAFGNFAHYCVVLLNAPLTVSAMGYFSRKILIYRHWRQEVPLSHWFWVSRGEIT